MEEPKMIACARSGGARLDLQQVADQAVAGQGLRERALRGLALGARAAKFGEEVLRQGRPRRALGLDGVDAERVRDELYQRGAVARHQHLHHRPQQVVARASDCCTLRWNGMVDRHATQQLTGRHARIGAQLGSAQSARCAPGPQLEKGVFNGKH